MAELNEKIFETMENKLVGLVIALFIVAGIQMAIYSLFLELRDLTGAKVGEWAGTLHLLPNQNEGVQLNMVVQGSKGVQRETGAVKWQLQGIQTCWQSSKMGETEKWLGYGQAGVS